MGGIERVRAWLSSAAKVGVLTGAGMSTASGIPDFRGPTGIWTTSPESQRLSSIDAYLSDPEIRRRSWVGRREHPAWTATPNDGHLALVALEDTGRLTALATQNIDGLHQAAGSRQVLELHGTIRDTVCLACADRRPMAETLDRLDAGETDPPCRVCGGVLKSATVSFGQSLVPAVLTAARAAAADAEVYLAIGTTLSVQPAAALCQVAVDHGARLVIVNDAPTPYDGIADVRLDGRIEQVLPAIVGAAAAPSTR